jgi:hypothetical protein
VRPPPYNLNPGDAGVLGDVDISSVSTGVDYWREKDLLALLGLHVWIPENQDALNFANGRHQNLAHLCAQLGYNQLLLVLIEQGINIHKKDVNGWIPLDFARLHKDEEAVDILEGGWVECGQHPCPTHVSLNPAVVPRLSSDCKMDPSNSKSPTLSLSPTKESFTYLPSGTPRKTNEASGPSGSPRSSSKGAPTSPSGVSSFVEKRSPASYLFGYDKGLRTTDFNGAMAAAASTCKLTSGSVGEPDQAPLSTSTTSASQTAKRKNDVYKLFKRPNHATAATASGNAVGIGVVGPDGGPLNDKTARDEGLTNPQGPPSKYCVAARNLGGRNIPFLAHQVVYNADQNSPHDAPADFERPTSGGSHRRHSPHPGATPSQRSGPWVNTKPVKPLIVTKNRWAPSRRRLRINKNSVVYTDRQVKALLNKLTLEKFEAISKQILKWANRSVNETDGHTLIQVIRLVYEAVTDDTLQSEMYARLCRFLMERISPNVRDDSICNNKDGKPIAGGNLFRKYLLNRCQEDFERGWSVKEAAVVAKISGGSEKDLHSDEYYAAQNARRRGLGLIKFIGELFKLQMLTERIMHECIKKLLSNVENPEEEEIESLCMLLATVGLTLDHAKARGHMDIYFSRMKELASGGKISFRVQFMILVCKAVHFHCLSPYLFAGHHRTSSS